MVDEAHGAGVLGELGAGSAELLGVAAAADLRMGTFSKSLASCGGFVAGPHEVIDYLRISSRAFLFTASAVPAAVGAALAALRIVRSPEGPELCARALENARRLRDGLHERGFAVVAPQELPADGAVQTHAPGVVADPAGGLSIVTPIVPVLVGDDWKAVLLWRALYDAGVFVNTALHPAVPPGGALLRTSVMATHDARDARPRAGYVRRGQGELRGRARPAPRPRASTEPAPAADVQRPRDLSRSSQAPRGTKKPASSVRTNRFGVDRGRVPVIASAMRSA